MTSEELFSISVEVINLIENRTTHVPTALRILEAAKQGFGLGFNSFSDLREHLRNEHLTQNEGTSVAQ
jgi:hypothetical protein